ncbi:DNA-methyltransferase [Haloferax denitrificans]|uniref:DNA-methyltransferase n=1 Tax=Haloferax denitrificans TaxID=35745 RepID=UPI003C6EED77
MTTDLNEWVNQIHQGDSFELVEGLPDDSINCVVTSPPYWGLRDYGTEDQMGLEDTLDEYVTNLVTLGDKLKRVLRDDGSWWLNIGDIFVRQDIESKERTIRRKSKALLPHRVAIALSEAGWIVRSDVVWDKTNPMPHSVSDRLNEEKEYLFQLVQEPEYWFDLDSIRESYSKSSIDRINSDAPILNRATERYAGSTPISGGANYSRKVNPKGKNPGDVWEAPVPNFSEGHFAVYPEKLIERPIKSSCPPKICSSCRTPHKRKEDGDGWQKDCDCDSDDFEPGIVLDPFMGSGTTAAVAKRLGRKFVGFELNPDYVAIAQRRAGITVEEPERLMEDDDMTTLTDFE